MAKEIRTKEKNIKFVESLGIRIDNIPRNFMTINLVNNTGFQIRTPITFTMGEEDLDRIVTFISSLGLPGKRVVKALVKSVKKLTRTDLDEIKNNFWCVGYTPEQIIKYAQENLMATLKFHRVPLIPIMDLDKESLKHFVKCFGGYRGVQALFTEVIEKTADEFRRVRKAEEQLNKDKIESEISSDELGSVPLIRGIIKKQCFTCKHCYTDRMGYQICLKKARPIPENLTIAEVNDMYPSGRIYDCNLMKSRFIIHDVHSCEDYSTRVF